MAAQKKKGVKRKKANQAVAPKKWRFCMFQEIADDESDDSDEHFQHDVALRSGLFHPEEREPSLRRAPLTVGLRAHSNTHVPKRSCAWNIYS